MMHRSISFYHLSRRNRAKTIKSCNSDGNIRTHITHVENLQQGEMLKNLGMKKVIAKDMRSREIWSLPSILIVLDHNSSSLLLFTNSISQTYLDNVRKFRRGKFNCQEQAQIEHLFSTKRSMHKCPYKAKSRMKTARSMQMEMYEVNNFFEPIQPGLALGNSIIP